MVPDDEMWAEYYREAKGFRGYLPNPDELQARIELLHKLQMLGLTWKVIGSIMMYDSPCLEVVLRMVRRHGAKETCRRCEPFCEET